MGGRVRPWTETSTPKLQQVIPTFGEQYCYPQVSELARDDVFFDIQGFLAEEVAQEMALKEGQAVGVVIDWQARGGFGWIRLSTGGKLFCHVTAVQHEKHLLPGTRVQFVRGFHQGHPTAKRGRALA